MNVTKSNFRQACDNFEAALEKCEFITIDCEFTGVSTETIKILPYDSPDHAYRKYSDNCGGFIIIQLGVTLVQSKSLSSTENDEFIYNSYNFYVCPRSWKTNFLCQASSMTFLAENGFDFTKLFKDGVPYCNEQEEKIMRERLREKQKMREETKRLAGKATLNTSLNHIPVPDEEKDTLNRIQEDIKEFINSKDDEKIIGGCNGFQRKLVYELIEANFANKIVASTKNVDNGKAIVVQRRKSDEEEERMEQDLRRSELYDLEDNIGITKILQKISASRKPIIGHNNFLDILYIIRQFFRPLPDSLLEFKKLVVSIFPNIIDTKFMCNLPSLKTVVRSSVLADVVQTVSQAPFFLPIMKPDESEFSYSLENNKAHEAGFDSYITAISFLSIAKYVHGSVDVIVKDINEANEYLNKVFMVKLTDVGYLNFVGAEPIPSRDHVFHVTVPEDWKQSDLVNQFRNYGQIFVTWINATSALISLHKRENSNSVLKTIESCDGFKIQSFNTFKETLQYRINGSDSSTPKQARKRKRSDDHKFMDSSEKKLKTSSSNSDTSNSKCPKQTSVNTTVKGFNESDDW